MKQARGAGGVSGEVDDDDDDFQVVPVESTSEYDSEVVSIPKHFSSSSKCRI